MRLTRAARVPAVRRLTPITLTSDEDALLTTLALARDRAGMQGTALRVVGGWCRDVRGSVVA